MHPTPDAVNDTVVVVLHSMWLALVVHILVHRLVVVAVVHMLVVVAWFVHRSVVLPS